MDLSKAEGIIEAIEAESRQPSPSHNNLARLIAMFFRDVIAQPSPEKTETKTVSEPAIDMTVPPEQIHVKPKSHRTSKSR